MIARYWHPHALRRPMREIAARYPVTYRKVGEAMTAQGFDVDLCRADWPAAESFRLFVAILAAMPPHVVPYGSMGDETPWGRIDWLPFLLSLQRGDT